MIILCVLQLEIHITKYSGNEIKNSKHLRQSTTGI